MMKKAISFLLIITLLLSVAGGCFVGTAASTLIQIGDYQIDTAVNFTPEDDKEAQLYRYSGTETVLDIPEYIGEYKITSVNAYAVSSVYNKAICVEQINLPETVIDLDTDLHNPLVDCTSCAAIAVDAQNPVFAGESGVLYSKDYTRLVRVPCAYPGATFSVKAGVQTIGRGAMACCGFSDIVFPETLTDIEQSFMERDNIEELYFPNSLLHISPLAFRNVSGLKAVYFGANVQISEGFSQYDRAAAPSSYSSIREFSVSGNHPDLSTQDGVLFNKDKTELICYPRGKSDEVYVIPDSVKSLATYAFSGTVLTTLNTNKLETIGFNAIDTVSIRHYIFGEAAKSVAINSSLFGQYTESWTFYSRDCDIQSSAFSQSKKTIYGYYGSTIHQAYLANEYWQQYHEFVLLDEEPELGFKYTELTNDTVRIDSFTGLEAQVEVPAYIDGKKVVQIGAYAFKGNTSITSLTLPQTLEIIDSHAFDDLAGVSALTIPASVTKIGSLALSGMSGLTKLNINSFTCEIEEGALPNARIFACSGSTAESYAANHNLGFVSVGHQFTTEEIEENKLKKTCSLCGYTEIVDNPAIHHDYQPEVIAPTCTEQGYTVYTCSHCGDSYTADYKAALGHEPFEIKATSPTCKVGGKTAGIQCARCQLVLKQQETIAKLPHEYDGGNITSQPTCTQEGIKTFRCRNCDAFYTEAVKKTAHNYVGVVKASTCTEQGYTTYTCSGCGDSYVADQTPLAEHTPQVIAAVAATCTKEGSTAGSKCAACGLVLLEPQTTQKLPHQYNSGVITLASTCQQEGTKTFRCKHCTAFYEQKLAKVDHNFVNVVKKAASFSQNGVLNEECSMCKQLRKSTVVKALKAAKLSVTVLTYTGKNLAAPKVTVTDSTGKTVAAKYYTVTYLSRANGKAVGSIKAIGQYKVKLSFKGAYAGSKYLYFTVKPRTITQYKPTTAKKAITAKWKKDTSATGYQVVIATNKSFTAGKKVYALKNTLTSKKITGLKSGKVYYVRIRAYKQVVVDGKKLNMYSSYSAVKAVKCK